MPLTTNKRDFFWKNTTFFSHINLNSIRIANILSLHNREYLF